MANQFGKLSVLNIDVVSRDKETYLKDSYFTAPYKIMKPFPLKNGGIQIMLQCASAGVMEGDRSEFNFHVEEGANLKFVSQSYEKLHPMRDEGASRYTNIQVDKNASFTYYPLPVIPFAESAFSNITEVDLDETSTFRMVEILTCGRYGSGELFKYSSYKNKVEIKRTGKIIYFDNTLFEPENCDMSGIGMYEGYTHLCNIFLSRGDIDSLSQIRAIINNNEEVTGGASILKDGDIAIRILGKRAQTLEGIAKEILEL